MKVFMPKFIKFIAGGAVAYVINLSITILLTEVFHFYYLLSFILALITVLFFNFFFAMKVIFKVNEKPMLRFLYYIIAYGIFMLMNIALVKVTTEILRIYYIVSIITVTGVLFIIKFIVYDLLIFNQKNS